MSSDQAPTVDKMLSRPEKKRRTALSERDIKVIGKILHKPPKAAGFQGDHWSPPLIRALLSSRFNVSYTSYYAIQCLRKRGLQLALTRGRRPKLDKFAIRKLGPLLRRSPNKSGLTGDTWSRARIAQLIDAQFGIRYSRRYVGRLARKLQIKPRNSHRERRLRHSQVRSLRALLKKSPLTLGFDVPQWTRPAISTLIADRFKVVYHPNSISRVLQRWSISVPTTKRGPGHRMHPKQIEQLSAALAMTPQAIGLEGAVWTQRLIARYLDLHFGIRSPANNVNRVLARLGLQPAHRARRGGVTALNSKQAQELAQALQQSPAAFGNSGTAWTAREISRFIQERFQVTCSPGSIHHMLNRLGLRTRNAGPFSAVRIHPTQNNVLGDLQSSPLP